MPVLRMRLFGVRALREAVAYAAQGGFALHLAGSAKGYPGALRCFQAAKEFAHLFGKDAGQLWGIARLLGVKQVVVHYAGTPRAHVDLCGKPLELAKRWCEEREAVVAAQIESLRPTGFSARKIKAVLGIP